MTSLEAYEKLLIKVNRNDSNSNIHVPRGKFVVVFNEQQRNWFKEHLKAELGSDELDQLQDFLQDDIPLLKLATHHNHYDFSLPDDFYRFATGYCLADKGECKGRVVVIWNTKSKNINVLLGSENHNPSFDYEETISSSASGKLKVYFSDFSVSDVFLSYYRFAKDIDLQGYIKVDGTQSGQIDPEVSNDIVDDILDLCAQEIMRNNGNTEGFQLANTRVQQD